MKNARIALDKVLFWSYVALAAGFACLVLPGNSAAFSIGSLAGGYGCLGRATTSDSTGSLSGLSEIMRLGFDGAGNIKGTIVLNLQGEVCNIATTGTYSVAPGGLGTMNLNWNAATGDADGDANCATTFNGKGIAQHTPFVVEAGGNALEFEAGDDFLTAPASLDTGDLVAPFVGSCRKQ